MFRLIQPNQDIISTVYAIYHAICNTTCKMWIEFNSENKLGLRYIKMLYKYHFRKPAAV